MSDDRRWPAGLVPYEFDPSVKPVERDLIVATVEAWNQHTSVRFAARGKQPDYVRFTVGHMGHSTIGRAGGEQVVGLPRGFDRGLVLHESGHALGLHHEHTRPDRDDWVKIHLDNARPEDRPMLKAIEPRLDEAREYDYGSVMHYAKNALARPGRITIEPIRVVPPGVVIGDWSKLGRGDVESIRLLYG